MKLDALQLGKFVPQKNNQLNGISFLVYAQLHAYNMQVLVHTSVLVIWITV